MLMQANAGTWTVFPKPALGRRPPSPREARVRPGPVSPAARSAAPLPLVKSVTLAQRVANRPATVEWRPTYSPTAANGMCCPSP
jgi:hypothetical protein